MVAVPATINFVYEVQDVEGFKALLRVVTWDPDVSADALTVGDIYTAGAALGTAVQGMTNAKVVRSSFSYIYDIAQEPSSETGQYRLVTQKAHLTGGDGMGTYMSVSVPAPKDSLFLTTSEDNLIVVNPASTALTAFQTACAGLPTTPRGGEPFAQFFGGQLRGVKPRVRRVLQGA
jgi:hypothetical protein